MKKNFKPQPWLYPEPVLVIVSKDKEGVPNAMVAAWGGMYDTYEIGFTMDHNHKSCDNILSSKAFTVSLATVDTMEASDYLGTVSGHRVPDKMAKTGLTVRDSEFVNAPVIEEYPLTFECELKEAIPVGEDYHFVGLIKNIFADESILTDGKIDYKKLDPLTLDPIRGTYVKLGEVVGKAYQVGVQKFAKK